MTSKKVDKKKMPRLKIFFLGGGGAFFFFLNIRPVTMM